MVNKLKMPLTRDQIADVKIIIKQTIDEIFNDDNFIKILVEKIEHKFEIKETQQKVQDLELRINVLERENEKLQGSVDNFEQHLKRNTFRIYGIKENTGENTFKKIVHTIKTNLKVEVDETNLVNCFRNGKVMEGKERPILFTVDSHNLKLELLKNRKNLKGSGMSLSEDMPLRKYQLLKKAIEKWGKEHVWYYGGHINVKNGQKKMKIKTEKDLI